MTTTPYIGSQISLISKSDIRYEGMLHGIDPKEHSVTLSNVRSFGTEGRKEKDKEILGSSETYEIIVFRGGDIKDITVIQASQPETTPPPVKLPARRTAARRPQQVYGELRGNPNDDLKQEYEEDFRFEDSQLPKTGCHVDKAKGYDKAASFFDNITSTVTEKETHFDRGRQKVMDNETFGEDTVAEAERRMRSARGGRRRGRLRGRGRGRYRPREH